MSWRRIVHRGGTIALWLFLIYWSAAFVWSMWEVLRHLVVGDPLTHVAAHAGFAVLYALGTLLGLTMLFPMRECPQCHGWGSEYLPHQEAVATKCHVCDGKGRVLTRR